jgi:hypothetical protein
MHCSLSAAASRALSSWDVAQPARAQRKKGRAIFLSPRILIGRRPSAYRHRTPRKGSLRADKLSVRRGIKKGSPGPPRLPPVFSLFLRANSKCEVSAQAWQISGGTKACTDKWSALPECHICWRAGQKKAPDSLMQLGRSEAHFAHCAGREAGAKRAMSRLDGGH